MLLRDDSRHIPTTTTTRSPEKKVSPYHAGQTIGIEHYGLDAWPRGPPRQEKQSTGMERSAILDVSFLSSFFRLPIQIVFYFVLFLFVALTW